MTKRKTATPEQAEEPVLVVKKPKEDLAGEIRARRAKHRASKKTTEQIKAELKEYGDKARAERIAKNNPPAEAVKTVDQIDQVKQAEIDGAERKARHEESVKSLTAKELEIKARRYGIEVDDRNKEEIQNEVIAWEQKL
jgi:ribosomal protein L13E